MLTITVQTQFQQVMPRQTEQLKADLQDLQSIATPDEKLLWKKANAEPKRWYLALAQNGKLCLPIYLFSFDDKLTHGKDHMSKGGMVTERNRYWYTK